METSKIRNPLKRSELEVDDALEFFIFGFAIAGWVLFYIIAVYGLKF